MSKGFKENAKSFTTCENNKLLMFCTGKMSFPKKKILTELPDPVSLRNISRKQNYLPSLN